MPARVWCWTPNPVLEIQFSRYGRLVTAGGKAHNVARQLNQWGVPAISLFPKVGGDWLKAVQKERVPVREMPICSLGRTGWAWMEGPGRRIDFFTDDPRWRSLDWERCCSWLIRWMQKGDWLVVAGSTPKGDRVGWWRSLFLGLREKGVRIVVDGKGKMLREALEAGVEWAKGNLGEAEETMSCKGEHRSLAAMRKISKGKTSLMVTLGSRGLVLRHGDFLCKVPAPQIRLQDATGSGDVVTAALIYGMIKGWQMRKIARVAAWAGSQNAARRNQMVARLKGRGVFA